MEDEVDRMNDRLKKMWSQQREFSKLHYDVGEMDSETREAKTRELSLALHHEVSKLVSAVNFRGHRQKRYDPDRDKILYEVVDSKRYAMSIANLWDFDDEDFEVAWNDKEEYLRQQHRLENVSWQGQPVIIWDVDDVLATFREDFALWVNQTKGIPVSASSPEYFFIEALEKTGYSSVGLYEEFIKQRKMQSLGTEPAVEVLNDLHDQGFWTYIITARPRDNLLCRYDTYHWLRDVGVKYDDIAFTAEKLAHVTRTRYHMEGKVVCAVDDGPNHVRSYSSHGIMSIMPDKTYNKGVQECDLVVRYHDDEQLKIALRDAINNWRIKNQ